MRLGGGCFLQQFIRIRGISGTKLTLQSHGTTPVVDLTVAGLSVGVFDVRLALSLGTMELSRWHHSVLRGRAPGTRPSPRRHAPTCERRRFMRRAIVEIDALKVIGSVSHRGIWRWVSPAPCAAFFLTQKEMATPVERHDKRGQKVRAADLPSSWLFSATFPTGLGGKFSSTTTPTSGNMARRRTMPNQLRQAALATPPRFLNFEKTFQVMSLIFESDEPHFKFLGSSPDRKPHHLYIAENGGSRRRRDRAAQLSNPAPSS